MPKDNTAPATKEDVRLLMKMIGTSEERMTRHFNQEIAKRIRASEVSVKRHFDVAVETIRHDLLGANADEIESLKNRVTRIETHVGLTAA